ncbi:A-kinase anchor protein 13 isoform X4 [Ischnura elegans]|uniref:A-kinase anchor protein 13 isoform X4 n=1 Tax=Ischnura elegans TaxID=197161 RepID=UPI001ED889F0|nr:A-kinase anchor protein 13 isoform X4 [Ischnura elegans]
MDRLTGDARLNPFYSDEFSTSAAEESDEDVITDYLAATSPATDPPSADGLLSSCGGGGTAGAELGQSQASITPAPHAAGGTMAAAAPPQHKIAAAAGGCGGGGPLVPTISVTPHSPGSKHYPILEDSLQQLHDIHESIQQMRELSAQAFNQQILRLNQYSRLSSSCPSLNNDPGSDTDLASANSSPTQGPLRPLIGLQASHRRESKSKGSSNKDWLMSRSGIEVDTKRRRSWTALGEKNNRDKKSADQQRSSLSLSSLESDNDDTYQDQTDDSHGISVRSDPSKMPGGATSAVSAVAAAAAAAAAATAAAKSRRYSGTTSPVSCATWNSGGASTHSLNEADLQNDFNKIVAKRESESLRLLPARLPLQKSVSTPSILAVRDIANDSTPDGVISNVPTVVEATEPLRSTLQKLIDEHESQRPSGTESETEEEMLAAMLASGKHLIDPQNSSIVDDFFSHSAGYGNHEEKRRKRGSIFFRKKKDKVKKATHQWISVCYGSAHACDWCSKPLTNKPGFYCEICTVTVHQNSCKDHIVECSKPKTPKSLPKPTGLAGHIPVTKLPAGKRGSGSVPNQGQQGTGNRRITCYSQWKRVATKLGVNQIISEEKEGDHSSHHESVNFSDEVPLVPFEFLDEGPITASDLETDPFLGLQDEEPDSWTPTVSKEVTKKLKEKEIKRQEHIYEFILTEKHHCLTLRVMQKVFVEGLQKYFQLGSNVDRMFPRLLDLTEIHLGFLEMLRKRQRTGGPVIESIGDILLEQFSGEGASRLKSAYGEFCSRHRDAVDIYKYYLQHDRRFGEFVRHCQANPLLKKKGIPECILFVTQRLTKYPLLIEPLIKTAKDNKTEREMLGRALALVKEILVEVDAQVAEKEKEDRKIEIYNRIDAKSFTIHRGMKFKKSDILSANRKLRFEGVAMLMQGRSKMQVVLVIVLSDVLFFLQENNHKYSFFTPDNKAGVVSLQKLLVREKAGQESRGIYLISSNPADPEMFELKVHKPKEKQVWIEAIRSAVQNCPEDEEESLLLSSEEKRKLLDAKHSQIRQLVGILRQKDVEQALILEEKMALQLKLLATAGHGNLPEPPNYCHLVTEDADNNIMWKEVISAVQEVSLLASSLYASGTNLSRSVSSVGEHQSEAYVSPTLPKRAETFGGFDNANKESPVTNTPKAVPKKNAQKDQDPHSPSQDVDVSSSGKESTQVGSLKDGLPPAPPSSKLPPDKLMWRNAMISSVSPGVIGSNLVDNASELPALLSLGREQQLAAVQLSHYVYTLLCIISQQMTSIDSLQAQLSACKAQLNQEDGRERRPIYRHNQQLEELRNLQDRLSQEKEAWQREREVEERDVEEKKAELSRLQEQIRADQADIAQQREQLYRKMEILTSQGILISPNMPVVTSVPHEEPSSSVDIPSSAPQKSGNGDSPLPTPSPPGNDGRRTLKGEGKWKGSSSLNLGPAQGKASLPLNLISATNQQKAAQGVVQVKQQLPLKLATKLGASGSSGILPGGVVVGPSRDGVQQILPLRLSQAAAGSGGGAPSEVTKKGHLAGASSGLPYQRLSLGRPVATKAEESSVPSGSATLPSQPTHVRTGSSPAMMQNTESQQASGSVSGSGGGRTDTYPKAREKYRVTSPDSAPRPKAGSVPAASDEEVIFF